MVTMLFSRYPNCSNTGRIPTVQAPQVSAVLLQLRAGVHFLSAVGLPTLQEFKSGGGGRGI